MISGCGLKSPLTKYGASSHRMGKRAMSAAHAQRHSVGVPVRKIPSILRTLTGVKITQSAVTQDALRCVRRRSSSGSFPLTLFHRLRNPLINYENICFGQF